MDPRRLHELIVASRLALEAAVEALFADGGLSSGLLAIRAAWLVGLERIRIALWWAGMGLGVAGYVLVMAAIADDLLGLGIFPR
jgi:uncharacterized membrane protein